MFAKRPLSGMYRLPGPILAALVLTAPAGASPAPVPSAQAAAKLKDCRTPKDPSRKTAYYVRVRGVNCGTAWTLIHKVITRAPKGCLELSAPGKIRLSSPCRISDYRCTARVIVGGNVLDTTCKRGTKLVRFQVQNTAY
jgi:hypothetical protein